MGLPNKRLKLAGAGGNEELCWLASEASEDLPRTSS